jgi:FlaA1/EpsC-like NDP-sugar epimerase
MKKYGSIDDKTHQQIDAPQVILIGSNASADVFLREVVINEDITFNFIPVGILTLDSDDVGHVIKGVPILGEVRDLGKVLYELREENIFPRQLVITEKSIPDKMKNYLLRYVEDHNLLLMHVIHQYTFNPVS